MRRIAPALLVTALLVTACSKSPAPPPPGDSVSVPTVSDSAPAEELPTTASGWNDRSLILIRAEKWEEAAEAAQAALKLDPGNSPAYFNLGRALLGANKPHEAVSAFQQASRLTNQSNADVEYFLGHSLALSGNLPQAIAVYEQALVRMPGDKEIAGALAELRQQAQPTAAKQTYQADVDLDGAGDDITILAGKVTVQTQRGVWDFNLQPSSQLIKVLVVKDGPPVLIFSMEGCTTLLRWNPAAKAVQQFKSDVPCGMWHFPEDGKVGLTIRSFPWVITSYMRWEGDGFVPVGTGHKRLMSSDVVTGENLAWVMDELLSGRAEGLELLFPTPENYKDFVNRAPPGLRAGTPAVLADGTVGLSLLVGDQVRVFIVFATEHIISSVVWK